jgi:hypothetical protein
MLFGDIFYVFILRIIRNTHEYSVGKRQSFFNGKADGTYKYTVF